jgi:hypothetical protein
VNPSTLQKFSKTASRAVRRIIVLGTAVAVGSGAAPAMGQPARAPASVATNQSNQPAVQGVITYPEPPPGFDPLTASDKDLTRYGFPPRPDARKAPESYRHWRSLVLVPRIANPTLQRTTIYNGSALRAPAKYEPQ